MDYPFLQRLRSGPLLADGAIGTLLYAEGVDYHRCFEELNLSQPNLVQGIHRRYITAGAELIETNTYGGNRIKLAAHGLEGRVRDINYAGAKVAREAREVSGEPVYVAGSMGPSGLSLRPGVSLKPEALAAAFQEQAEALLEGGVDLLIFETFTDAEELALAVRAARGVSDLPIIAQVTLTEDLKTLAGQDVAAVVRALEGLEVDVLGANCTIGPQGVLDVVTAMAGLTSKHISAMPNAGLPRYQEGRYFYLSTPQYFAEYAGRFLRAGVRIIGGCCGTTPQHIRAMREALAVARPSQAQHHARPTVVEEHPEAEDAPSPPAEAPTELARKLREGKFVVSVELDPPKGINPAKVLAGAAMLKEQGVDCINIGDSPMARVRMSALAMAVLIQQRVGLETIIHFTARDRNLMAIQSDLIGAHALGVRNVIALTGDPPRIGDYLNATAVWDVDSIGLISILKRLNEGRDFAGNSIARPTNFFVACAVTPTAPDLAKEQERFRRKLEAGTDFVMTQPLYTEEDLEKFLDDFGPVPAPVLLGILPMQSYRHAEFLHHEVGGIEIPERLRERMRRAGDRGREEGLAISLEFVTQVKGKVDGIYIMPSFGRYELAADIVRALHQE
ncbi:MAG: bifunctional homocysteine S-methyltransferase/methylenetetrahydrofolate reductase [Chloroflexi bacterium]|nr:bifunctional homocysteine S-methyltransferase/methylenetetrahydrofolate reductase [Chloroflexota bacterium]